MMKRTLFFLVGIVFMVSCAHVEETDELPPEKEDEEEVLPVPDHVDLLPLPDKLELLGEAYPMKRLNTISLPQQWLPVGESFIAVLDRSSSWKLAMADDEASVEVREVKELAEEAYTLDISKENIVIGASDEKGLAHAFATLHQLILTAEGPQLPTLSIQDHPELSYRGMMLDCARHFWTVKELKKTIDNLSFFKFNVLHLHLTDNQAWRFAMDKYPELVEKGTYYYDFPELSGKYYTKADLKEVVRYAQSKGVEIIPEIDLPGHATALLAAFPELSCRGGEFEAYPEERPAGQRKRADENMVCVGNPQVYAFAEDVIDALVEIFPSKYIHLGGDEVPYTIWMTCPKCQGLLSQGNMWDYGQLQDYFTRRMSQLVRSKGKTMIGWDEINDRNAATSDDVLAIWRNTGQDQQFKALDCGIPMIMCPQHGCYFDWGYAGNSTRKVYEFKPFPDRIMPEHRPLVLGGQANLWTERVKTQDRVEWLLFPRMCALAEVLWTPQEKRSWEGFYQRLLRFYPVMEAIDIHFYEDEALNEEDFVADGRQPALVRKANIQTNIPQHSLYFKEYAFDGRSNSFFWGGTTIRPGHYFTLVLDEALPVSKVKVITGDSKDYITMADLMISLDGSHYEKVASFNEFGVAEVKFDSPKAVKSVMIQVTGEHSNWPIIREIILK